MCAGGDDVNEEESAKGEWREWKGTKNGGRERQQRNSDCGESYESCVEEIKSCELSSESK